MGGTLSDMDGSGGVIARIIGESMFSFRFLAECSLPESLDKPVRAIYSELGSIRGKEVPQALNPGILLCFAYPAFILPEEAQFGAFLLYVCRNKTLDWSAFSFWDGVGNAWTGSDDGTLRRLRHALAHANVDVDGDTGKLVLSNYKNKQLDFRALISFEDLGRFCLTFLAWWQEWSPGAK